MPILPGLMTQRRCEFCGTIYEYPMGNEIIVERTMDIEPPAEVKVYYQIYDKHYYEGSQMIKKVVFVHTCHNGRAP